MERKNLSRRYYIEKNNYKTWDTLAHNIWDVAGGLEPLVLQVLWGAAFVAVFRRMCEAAICHLAQAGLQRQRE